MSFWKSFFASFLASIVSGVFVIIIFFVILGAFISGFDSMFESKPLVVKDNTVLHLKLDGSIGDQTYANFDPASFQFNQQFGLFEIINGLERAKTDDKIKGIFLNISEVATGMANLKEIRDALEDFKTSGKFIVAYNENYSKKGYYLSSVADEVYVFPTGTFDLLGLSTEIMFLKGAFEKLDIELQIIRGSNNKFKSAVEPFIYDKMSDENREQVQKYLNALWNEMLVGIEKNRGVSVEKLNEIADSAYIRKSGQAVDYQLADGVKYYDEVLEILKTKSGTENEEEVELLSFKKYASKKAKKQKNPNIALIFAEGDIVDGEGEIGQIGGTSMSKLIREARQDSTIKAVVLRINSPGGSALASDVIWREVVLTKEVKPVIVSMGNVAASGGYYIACAADKIYAQPNTITGSIGVFGVIPYVGDFMKNKLGITFDRVQTNQHANVMSINKKLTDKEFKLIQGEVDDIYDDFISKVAQGRNMTKEEVDSIGQGRVWAGVDAKSIGLVDEYGGMYNAIYDAAERVNIKKEDIKIKIYTTAKTDKFLELIQNIEEEEDLNTKILMPSEFQIRLMEMYGFVKSLENSKGVQARLPYLYWIE